MSSRDGARYLDKALCTLALALAPALVLGGCGKKGPPLPPLRYVPAQTQDLAVAQRGDQILLRFTYPKTTAGGAPLESVTAIEVYEVDRPVPPPAPPAPAATTTTPTTTTPGTSATGTTTTAPKTGTTTATPSTTAPTTTAPTTTPTTTQAPTTGTATGTATGTTAGTTGTTTAPSTTAQPSTTTPSSTTKTPAAGTTSKPGASGVPPTPAVGAPSVPPPPANLPGNFPPIDARELDATAKVKTKIQGADVTSAIFGDKVVISLPVGEIHPAPAAPAAGSTAKSTTGTTTTKNSTTTTSGTGSTATTGDKSSKATASEKSSTEKTAASSSSQTTASGTKTTSGSAATTAPAAPTDLVRYYVVRTTGPKGDRSAFSNQAAIIPKPPPPPPGDLHLAPKADGIEVTWDAPAGTDEKGIVKAAGIKVLGFNIYRRDATAKAFGPPIRAAFFDSRKVVDQTARFGESYIYAVASIADVNPLRESIIRGESEVKYVDRFPPPVPADVVALAESGKVRLVWRASAAPDLAGYLIYRRAGQRGEFQKLTAQPVTEVQYLDGTVSVGTAYTYRVTAIDQSGNESAPGETQTRAQ